jgi:hypothetical protein
MMLLLAAAYLYAGFSVWFACHYEEMRMLPKSRDSRIDFALVVTLWPVVMPVLVVRRFR